MKTLISMDTETFLISRESPLPQVVCMSLYDGEAKHLLHHDDVPYFIDVALENPNVDFVGHNIAYDFGCIVKSWPQFYPAVFRAYKAGRVTDTGIRQQLFDIATGRAYTEDIRNYSLDDLSRLALDKAMKGKSNITGDEWRLRYAELYAVPLKKWPEAAKEYVLEDAVVPYEVHEAQQACESSLPGMFDDDRKQAYAAFCFTLMSANGMYTDAEAVRECREMWEGKQAALAEGLIAEGLLEYNKRTKKYVKKLKPARERIEQVCADLGIEVPKTKKSKTHPNGQTATDKFACLITQDRVMLSRADYITAEKMLSTYVPVLEQGTGSLPITTRINMAATGRTTSSTPSKPLEGTNFQNAPRKGNIRECFKPRPGHVFLVADFTGAELHTLAQTCKNRLGWSTLGDVLNEGKDAHLWTAATMLGIDYEEAVQRRRQGDQEVEKARTDAKPVNFGLPGGMGNKTFQSIQLKNTEVFWPLEKIERVRQAWLRAFPEMREYFDSISYELGMEDKTLMKVFPSGRLRKVRGYSTACNNPFQGGAADGNKYAFCEVSRRAYVEPASAIYGAFVVNSVHDEIVAEVVDHPDVYRPAHAEMVACMSAEFNACCPDYPVEVEAAVTRVWSKGAEPTYNDRGELIPWEPN